MLPEGPVLLYGYGAEGRSTHQWLMANGWGHKVFVTGDGARPDLDDANWLEPEKVAGALANGTIASIVKSPGVSLYKPIFEEARAANVPITSNLNLWASSYRAGRKIIAITGTKGKSTTTDLIWRMLGASGVKTDLAGNGGTPFLDLGARPALKDTKQGSKSFSGRSGKPADTVVMELSSYQTADMDFGPDIAGIVNLSPEHIDWHQDTKNYYADKLNLIDRAGDFAVALGDVPPDLVPEQGLAKKRVRELTKTERTEVDEAVSRSKLMGRHNLQNARFAARVALAAGANLAGVAAGIAAFEPLAHRLQPHSIGSKTFVDDSISTTPVSTLAALETYRGKKMALIGGGGDRGQDYSVLARALAGSSVSVLVCLPTSGARLASEAREFSGHMEVIEADDLTAGMAALAERADRFEMVLLSPGAPSQGLSLAPGVVCRNFAERGDMFIGLARSLFAAP